MMYDFNADEVFEMAQQMERNGANFYTTAAESVKDDDAKTMLLELASMEVDHEKTFTKLRSDLSEAARAGTVFDPHGESALYLKSLVDTRVFFEKEIDTTSLEAILKAAITAEKDSIVFYLGMKDAVPENLGKARLDAIIKEEMGHIKMLSNKLVSTSK